MDDSAITFDEIIESYDEETKTILKNEKKWKESNLQKEKFLYSTCIFIN